MDQPPPSTDVQLTPEISPEIGPDGPQPSGDSRVEPAPHSQNNSQNSAIPTKGRPRVLAMLTDAHIRREPPRQKAFELRDGQGLYLLVRPSGRRYWRFDYRLHGRRNVISLGVYPDVSLAKAREKRDEARRQVANGIDPSALRKKAKRTERAAHANTFADLWREWLEKRPLTEKTRKKLRYLMSHYADPFIGPTPISQVTPPDVLALLIPIERKGRHETAHRVKQTIGQVARYAVARGLAISDPTASLTDALMPVVKRHYSAITDPKGIGALLRDIDGYEGTAAVRQALRLAPYVFVRPGELRRAEWAEIDLDAALWRIPAKKMKSRQDHLVPLSRQAVALLTELQPWTGSGRYVFPSLTSDKRPISDMSLNGALRRIGYSTREMVAHGFRAMASTRLHEMGFDTGVIERQLAHREKDQTKAAYNRAAHLEARRKLMQQWANELDRLRRMKA